MLGEIRGMRAGDTMIELLYLFFDPRDAIVGDLRKLSLALLRLGDGLGETDLDLS